MRSDVRSWKLTVDSKGLNKENSSIASAVPNMVLTIQVGQQAKGE